MPTTKSAAKNLKQSQKRRAKNRVVKSDLKRVLKDFRQTIDDAVVQASIDSEKIAIQKLDRAANRRVIHRNKAARLKSRMSKLLKASKVAAAATISVLDSAISSPAAGKVVENRKGGFSGTGCPPTLKTLEYRRFLAPELSAVSEGKSRISQIVSRYSNMDASNQARSERAVGDILFTAWPFDLTLSIEMGLSRQSVSCVSKALGRIKSIDEFKNSDSYLLIPKVAAEPPTHLSAKAGNGSRTRAQARLVDALFDRCTTEPTSLSQYLGEQRTRPGILVLEGDPGDIRWYRNQMGQLAVYAALWLYNDLAKLGNSVVSALHNDGADTSLRRCCQDAIRDLLMEAEAILKARAKSNGTRS